MLKVSIIIRTKNEEYWIPKLLHQLKQQTIRDFEVILVDNESTDATVQIFEQMWPNGKILKIGNFKPGRAINFGIENSNAPFVAIISAHCIPTNGYWLENFLKSFDNQSVGAVYGRQLPLQTSEAIDKRDLLNIFGVEHRIQKKDTFFHNANSMIRKSVWLQYPFDEEAPHIEDRLWAEKLINENIWIAYNPDASVYHHHGINHHGNLKRAEAISEILSRQTINHSHELPQYFQPSLNKTLYCFLGHDKSTHEKFVSFRKDMGCDYPPGELILHTLNKELLDSNLNFFSYTNQDAEKSFVEILAELMEHIRSSQFYPDAIAYINLRADNLRWDNLNKAIHFFYDGMFDTVFWAEKEYSNVWQKEGEVYLQLRADYTKKEKKEPIYISRYGLGLVTLPKFVRNSALVGKKIAILPLNESI
jgi:rhamnosyltransferase